MAGIYLHIPFCKTRCIYCDFYSTTRSELKTHYVHTLCRELEMRKEYLKGEPVETIYFGGGTPSQLEEADFKHIFETIRENYGMEHCREITLEANPDDLSQEYLKMLSSLPFNRISMGIQTFDDTTLQLLKRRHSSQTAVEAVRRCREAGFQNISIDLIYGLPGETKERWVNDLRQAIRLDVEHISAYHLTYEEDTPIYNMLKQHQIEEVDEDSSLQFFTLLIEHLQNAGYEHYEISNFCLPGLHSRHNSSYWTEKQYLGCGPSAHSYNGISRQWNVASLDKYIEGISSGNPTFEVEELDLYTRYNDFVITHIRTQWGMPLPKLGKQYGEELYKYCLRMATPHLQQGTLEIKNDTLKLTRKGVFISNGIMSDMLWVE